MHGEGGAWAEGMVHRWEMMHGWGEWYMGEWCMAQNGVWRHGANGGMVGLLLQQRVNFASLYIKSHGATDCSLEKCNINKQTNKQTTSFHLSSSNVVRRLKMCHFFCDPELIVPSIFLYSTQYEKRQMLRWLQLVIFPQLI